MKVQYRSFKKAKQFARELNLLSYSEWKQFCWFGKKPHDIPITPHHIYKNKGWTSWGDFLGTGIIATYKICYW